MSKNTEMMTLSVDDLDVAELENRIEMAATTAQCDCGGSCSTKCENHAKVQAVKPATAPVAPGC